MLGVTKKYSLICISAVCLFSQAVLGEPNTNVQTAWQSAPMESQSGSILADIKFLDFNLGMSLVEVNAVLGSNSRYKSQGFGVSLPTTGYEDNVSGYYSKVSFPDFENVLAIQVSSDGVDSDMLYLFFLPDPENRRVYAMNRRVITDNRTIGRDNFWKAVGERLGVPKIYSGRQSGGSFSVVNIADYAWDSSGEAVMSPSCIWGNPMSSEGGVAFDVQPYNLTHLDFVANWQDTGCSAVAVVSEAGYSGNEAIYSYSMVAYAVDLYRNSLRVNNDVVMDAFSKIQEEIIEFKAGAGKSSPDL
jgi:hypothetical protein